MRAVEIDRFSPVPPYRQAAAWLRDRIISGELTGRLPSSRDLQGELGIAAFTAIKALRLLREEGWARVSPGMGTYAVPPGEQPAGGGEEGGQPAGGQETAGDSKPQPGGRSR